ncbi:hypothetical protein BVRB_9g208320 [Beta vulgaris subsp. vulgaris]|nr:hypothetical protein BVRB_9g208320 [Beta vulgaris subsp. vulgaris]
MSKPSILLPSKKRKCMAIKEEKASSEEVMAIMGIGLERPEPVEVPAEICLDERRPERTLKLLILDVFAKSLLFSAGVKSVYEWKGEIHTDSEELLIIKTRESLLGALTEHVKANHEYEVPEVIAMPIVGGNAPYLEWLKNNTRN